MASNQDIQVQAHTHAHTHTQKDNIEDVMVRVVSRKKGLAYSTIVFKMQ